ncbi:MAG: hypothetical protein MI806_09955 [Minwuiales bacterium]|nr:hypothetical protein [Minwuiales bacterium]
MKQCKSAIAAVVAAVALSLGGEAVAQDDSRPVPEIDWKASLKKFQFDHEKFVGQRFTAKCLPTSTRQKFKSIYGTNVYPSNNSLCTAALHAGKIDLEGGIVTVQLNPGAESYAGSSRNAIDSGDLPATQRSIVFIDETTPPEIDEILVSHAPRIDWETQFTKTGLAYRQLVGQRFTFNCHPAPQNMRERIVVGTDVYEYSSLVCRAAVHAGKMTTAGGLVTVQMGPRQKELVGSIRNGIESQDGSGRNNTISFVDNPVQR